MPLYDFTCTECGAAFEKRLSYSGDIDNITCPNGHHTVRRVYSSPQVVFKGSGWYITDHRAVSPSAAGSGTGN